MDDTQLKAMYRVLVAAVAIDGEQHPNEVGFLQHNAKIGGHEHKQALDEAVNSFFEKGSGEYSKDYIIGFASSGITFLVDADPKVKIEVLTRCAQVFGADGVIRDSERSFLLSICQLFGLDDKTTDKFIKGIVGRVEN